MAGKKGDKGKKGAAKDAKPEDENAAPPAVDGDGKVLPTPPDGQVPMFIQMKNLTGWGLQIGPTMMDIIPFKKFNLAAVLEEVQAMGFMSDWDSHKGLLKKSDCEEVLIVFDPTEKYGDRFLLCHTQAAVDKEMGKLEEAAAGAAKTDAARTAMWTNIATKGLGHLTLSLKEFDADKSGKVKVADWKTCLKAMGYGFEEEEIASVVGLFDADGAGAIEIAAFTAWLEEDTESAAAAAAAAEAALQNIVYEDKPVLSRPYASGTAAASEEEVGALTITPSRPLFACTVSRPVGSFGNKCTFGDREADNEKYCEFRSHKNPDFDLLRREAEVGLQSVPLSTDGGTQTTWFRPVNKAVQYAAIACGPDEKKEVEKRGARLGRFLRESVLAVEVALQENETVDIFSEAFDGVGDEDGTVGNKHENDLKELRTFNDIEFSKNMLLTAIDWHPTRRGMLATSPVHDLTFDERVVVSGQASTAFILIWDFVDLIHPQIMLQAPHDVFAFRFNTTQSHIVAAGLANGQVALWDMKAAYATFLRKQKKQRSFGSRDDPEEDEDEVVPLMPLALSHIDRSHKRMVSDLAWLPPTTCVNHRGQLLSTEQAGGDGKTSYQFLTISGDGHCFIWDTRYAEIHAGLHPNIKRGALTKSGGDKKKDDGALPPWEPLFRIPLKRLEGVGELSLCKVCANLGDIASSFDGSDRRSQMLCDTEEGEVVFADWRATADAAAPAAADDDAAGGGGGDAPEYARWMSPDHARPCVALEKSPFFPGVVLSVGDWNFRLWQLDHQTPIFSSPTASAYLTCGCWSPTRAGMLLVGKADGGIDVWDLTDSSYKPSVQLVVSPLRITSMQFLASDSAAAGSGKQQLLAVGDAGGNLHIFDMPRNLRRAAPSEKSSTAAFLSREVARVEYVAQRFKIREEEAAAAAAEGSAAETGGGGGGDDATDGSGGGDAAAEKEEAEMAAAEAEYAALEAALIEELGLEPADLPEHKRAALELAQIAAEGV